jgi:hypothetical protein
MQAALHSRLSQRFLTLHARVPTLSSTSRWVEPELLGVPPLVSVLAARYNGGSGTRSVADAVRCPSPEVPQCWLHPKEASALVENVFVTSRKPIPCTLYIVALVYKYFTFHVPNRK